MCFWLLPDNEIMFHCSDGVDIAVSDLVMFYCSGGVDITVSGTNLNIIRHPQLVAELQIQDGVEQFKSVNIQRGRRLIWFIYSKGLVIYSRMVRGG